RKRTAAKHRCTRTPGRSASGRSKKVDAGGVGQVKNQIRRVEQGDRIPLAASYEIKQRRTQFAASACGVSFGSRPRATDCDFYFCKKIRGRFSRGGRIGRKHQVSP